MYYVNPCDEMLDGNLWASYVFRSLSLVKELVLGWDYQSYCLSIDKKILEFVRMDRLFVKSLDVSFFVRSLVLGIPSPLSTKMISWSDQPILR